MGYIDPDELATGELSTASETYAFGLILLQMLTGITAVKQVRPSDTAWYTLYDMYIAVYSVPCIVYSAERWSF